MAYNAVPGLDPVTKRMHPSVEGALATEVVAPAAAAAAASKVNKGVDVYVKDFIVGDGVADDTAGWVSAIAAIPATGGKLIIDSGINSKVTGALTISGKDKLRVTGAGAKITQTASTSKTLNFVNCTGLIVEGVELVGKGTENVKQGIGVTSYNGVAGIFLNNCARVAVRNTRLTNHAGGGIRWTGGLKGAVISGNTVAGIGGTPGNSDNCSDIAIGMSGTSSDESIWIEDNDLSAHNFGIFAIATRSLHIQRNSIHDVPGQHGVYMAQCWDMEFCFNTLWNIALVGMKNQIGSSSPANVPSMRIIGNNVNGCQNGLVVGSVWNGLEYKFSLGDISHNVVRNAAVDGINVDSCLQFKIADNQIDTTGRYGIFCGDFQGSVIGNQIWRTQDRGIYVQVLDHSQIERNVLADCALNVAATAGINAMINVARSTNYQVAQPSVMLDQNGFHYTGTEPGTYAYAITTGSNVQTFHLSSRNFTTKGYSFALTGTLGFATPIPGTDPGAWVPADNGLIACDVDPLLASGTLLLGTAGVVYLRKQKVAVDGPIANVNLSVSTAGAGLTNTYVAVFSAAGAQLGVSADISTTLQTTGLKTIALTSPTASQAAGTWVYVAILVGSATTQPTLRATATASHHLGVASAANYRWASTGTGLTAMPSSFTPSGVSLVATAAPLLALS